MYLCKRFGSNSLAYESINLYIILMVPKDTFVISTISSEKGNDGGVDNEFDDDDDDDGGDNDNDGENENTRTFKEETFNKNIIN